MEQIKINLAAQYFEIFKVHKISITLRSILSSIATFGYKIAKLLIPILEPITSNQFTVQDSFTFATEISKFKDSNKYGMASFDFNSLFTNIPLDEPINIATESLFPENDVSLLQGYSTVTSRYNLIWLTSFVC